MVTTNIKKGYKQTELGVIPEDWDLIVLKDLNFDISDGNYSSKYPKSNDFKLFGVPFIRANNINNLKVVDDDMRYISVSQHGELLKGHLKQGDILITTRGDIGQIAIVPPMHIDSNINAQIVRINTKDYYNNLFLAYFITGSHGQEQVKNLQTGSALKQLPVGRLMQMRVIKPSKPEQIAIASVLSDTDALIDHLDKLITKKKGIKQGTMQQLLTGKKRLPGFSGGWVVKKLGEITELSSGGTPSTKINSYYNGTICWASIADMTSVGKYIFDTEKKLSASGLANSAAKIFPEGTVLYAMYASIGECCIARTQMATSQAILGIRCNSQIDNVFLYYHLTSIKNHIKTLGQQGTQSNLNKGMVQDFDIKLPIIDEQTAIATVLSDMDTEIEKLEAKRKKYAMLKNGMMQQLLTGNIRIYATK